MTTVHAVQLAPLTAAHWPEVAEIFAQGIATGNATFETTVPSFALWDVGHDPQGRRVAVGKDGQVVGFAALSAVSGRRCYAGVAEVSVYVAQPARRQRVGAALLDHTVATAPSCGKWMLQASIFPENAASLSLFFSRGFRQVGVRQRMGQLGKKWRDVVLLEKHLVAP